MMKEKHQKFIQQQFKVYLQHQTLIVLDLPDEYQYMDAELIELLIDSVPPYFA